MNQTQRFRTSEQLFVCYRGRQKSKAISKQRMAHWIVDVVTLAYQKQSMSYPLRLRANSTWSIASSWALAHGALLTDIYRAVGWATPNTFARFFSLCPVFSPQTREHNKRSRSSVGRYVTNSGILLQRVSLLGKPYRVPPSPSITPGLHSIYS